MHRVKHSEVIICLQLQGKNEPTNEERDYCSLQPLKKLHFPSRTPTSTSLYIVPHFLITIIANEEKAFEKKVEGRKKNWKAQKKIQHKGDDVDDDVLLPHLCIASIHTCSKLSLCIVILFIHISSFPAQRWVDCWCRFSRDFLLFFFSLCRPVWIIIIIIININVTICDEEEKKNTTRKRIEWRHNLAAGKNSNFFICAKEKKKRKDEVKKKRIKTLLNDDNEYEYEEWKRIRREENLILKWKSNLLLLSFAKEKMRKKKKMKTLKCEWTRACSFCMNWNNQDDIDTTRAVMGLREAFRIKFLFHCFYAQQWRTLALFIFACTKF